MLRDLEGKIKRYPVTCAVIVVASGLFVAARVSADGRQAWGYGSSQHLWEGEIWRLLVNTLHHGIGADLVLAFIHLAFNLYMLWQFGRVAEEYFGSLIYGGFLLACALVSGLASELTIESGAVGLSGVVYGLFGLLYAARHHSERIREAVNPSISQFMVGWLFFCVALTWLKMLPVANVAHFSGVIYGWGFGRVLFPTHREPRWRKATFLASHILVPAALLYAIFPIYNPEWRFWKGYHSTDPQSKIEHYEAALRLNPDLKEARFNLALALREMGRRKEAFDHADILFQTLPDDPDIKGLRDELRPR